MIKERIQALIKALGISGREFCKSIGQSDSWNRTIGNSIGSDVVSKILTTYPQVNIKWLVLGEGEKFNQITLDNVEESRPTCEINKNYQNLYEEVRKDNKDLREENNQLRNTVLELMHKNEKLLVENVQLKTKLLNEQV